MEKSFRLIWFNPERRRRGSIARAFSVGTTHALKIKYLRKTFIYYDNNKTIVAIAIIILNLYLRHFDTKN